jgi:hypothetical protein
MKKIKRKKVSILKGKDEDNVVDDLLSAVRGGDAFRQRRDKRTGKSRKK